MAHFNAAVVCVMSDFILGGFLYEPQYDLSVSVRSEFLAPASFAVRRAPTNTPLPVRRTFSSQAADDNCAVCIEPLTIGGSVLLGCGHRFHASCIVMIEQPRVCPTCRDLRGYPSRLVLNAAVNAESHVLRDSIQRRTATNNTLLAEIHELETKLLARDAERAQNHELKARLRERDAHIDRVQTENYFLHTELDVFREHAQAFAPKLALADLIVCASVKCVGELAAIASELADENRALLMLPPRRGLLFSRVAGERDGLMLLVRQMDQTNRMMAGSVESLESRFAALERQVRAAA